MTKHLLAAAAAVLLATAALAAEAPKGPAVLPAKSGAVTFQHTTHAAVKCETCHGAAATPGKLAPLGKDKAHALCVACHKTEKKGPAKCVECHKKA